MSLALIGLALSVFGWGTGYKLSLYYPPNSSSHLMPHAKLLSKNEQDSPKESIQNKHSKDTSDKYRMRTQLALLFALLLGSVALNHISAPSPRECESSRQRHLRQHTSLNFFFVLPPPVLA